MAELTESQMGMRRSTWKTIIGILAEPISDREKIAKCLNAASVYCALTGDDLLVATPVRDGRNAMISDLPRLMARAKTKAKNLEIGMEELI